VWDFSAGLTPTVSRILLLIILFIRGDQRIGVHGHQTINRTWPKTFNPCWASLR
jgi:hypothetical protein